MYSGLTIEKILVIGVIAALIIGPERLPKYAESLANLVRRGRDMLKGAQTRMRDEMGPEFDEVDWRKLDPRQYDPRRIIKEALLDDAPVKTVQAARVTAAMTTAAVPPSPAFLAGEAPPFDPEAT